MKLWCSKVWIGGSNGSKILEGGNQKQKQLIWNVLHGFGAEETVNEDDGDGLHEKVLVLIVNVTVLVCRSYFLCC